MVTGKLLIAKPYLGDPHFERSVVLICEHSEEGAFGLILNRETDHILSDFFGDVPAGIAVGAGGPVEKNTLHFIHTRGALIKDSIVLTEGLYWSGDFEQIRTFLNTGILKETDIRFFLGYSGWGAGQLEEEMAEDVWIPTDALPEIIFKPDPGEVWRNVLRSMGGNYIMMANSPLDPRLN